MGDSCALCSRTGRLRKSHIIPNAIFRRIKRRNDGKLISFTDAAEGRVEYTVDSWWEYLLCEDCEKCLAVYERVSIETLRGDRKDLLHVHDRGITFRDFDYAALKLFFTSLLWRTHASSLAPYARVKLLPHMADEARRSLLSGRPPSPSSFGCRLALLFDPTPNGFSPESIRELVTSPFPRVHKTCVSFVYLFEGYVVEIYVPRAPHAVTREHGFLKNARFWYVPKKNVFDVEELVKLFVSGYGKAERGEVTFSR